MFSYGGRDRFDDADNNDCEDANDEVHREKETQVQDEISYPIPQMIRRSQMAMKMTAIAVVVHVYMYENQDHNITPYNNDLGTRDIHYEDDNNLIVEVMKPVYICSTRYIWVQGNISYPYHIPY